MQDVLGVGKLTEKVIDPVMDLLKKIAGPAAEEIGLTLQDSVHVYRAKRAYKLAEKFKKFCEEYHVDPKPVAMKLLLPILDYSSIEDDDDLHTAWAALLVNAANPEARAAVAHYFPNLLTQLSPYDASLLNKMYDLAISAHARYISKGQNIAITDISQRGEEQLRELTGLPASGLQRESDQFVLAIQNLLRIGILERRMKVLRTGPPLLNNPAPPTGTMNPADTTELYITSIGYSFVAACRPPKSPAKPD